MAAEDSELIAAYLASGCRVSLDELTRRYLTRIRNVIFQMVLDHETADDLTQEVLLKAIRSLADFNGQAAFSSWMYRIAMNTAYTYLSRRQRSPLRFPGDVPERVDHTVESPDQSALKEELNARITQALDSLSPKLRAAIVLTSMHHCSPAEAAEIEGCSTATIYWRVHEARKQLQRQLEPWLRT